MNFIWAFIIILVLLLILWISFIMIAHPREKFDENTSSIFI